MSSFKTRFRVSWVETDAAQVVHFSNYFKFFERAEEELYEHLGLNWKSIMEKDGIWFPRVEAFCQFKAPSKFNNILEVNLTVEELKAKSIKYGFKIYNKETSQLTARGYIVVVAADKKTEKAVNLPKEFMDKLKPFVKAS